MKGNGEERRASEKDSEDLVVLSESARAFVNTYIRFNLRRNPRPATVLEKFFLLLHHNACLAGLRVLAVCFALPRSRVTRVKRGGPSSADRRRKIRNYERCRYVIPISRNTNASAVGQCYLFCVPLPLSLSPSTQRPEGKGHQGPGHQFRNLIRPVPRGVPLSSAEYTVCGADIGWLPALPFPSASRSVLSPRVNHPPPSLFFANSFDGIPAYTRFPECFADLSTRRLSS